MMLSSVLIIVNCIKVKATLLLIGQTTVLRIVFRCSARMILLAGHIKDGVEVNMIKCDIDACPEVIQIDVD